MAEWVEVPTHRMLVVSTSEYATDFYRLDEHGNAISDGSVTPALVIRYRDRRVFKPARFMRHGFIGEVALEEI